MAAETLREIKSNLVKKGLVMFAESAENKNMRVIKMNLVKKCLDMFAEIAENKTVRVTKRTWSISAWRCSPRVRKTRTCA